MATYLPNDRRIPWSEGTVELTTDELLQILPNLGARTILPLEGNKMLIAKNEGEDLEAFLRKTEKAVRFKELTPIT